MPPASRETTKKFPWIKRKICLRPQAATPHTKLSQSPACLRTSILYPNLQFSKQPPQQLQEKNTPTSRGNRDTHSWGFPHENNYSCLGERYPSSPSTPCLVATALRTAVKVHPSNVYFRMNIIIMELLLANNPHRPWTWDPTHQSPSLLLEWWPCPRGHDYSPPRPVHQRPGGLQVGKKAGVDSSFPTRNLVSSWIRFRTQKIKNRQVPKRLKISD